MLFYFFVLQKEDDLVFETFYHRSGQEFQCIYQSGMRFYLDDWGSKVNLLSIPKKYYYIKIFIIYFLKTKQSVSSMHRYPVWQHTFVSPSAFSRRAVVSYWRKYVHEVLVNRLGGLSLPRKSVARLTDRPDMTLDIYRGCKTPIQQIFNAVICRWNSEQCRFD